MHMYACMCVFLVFVVPHLIYGLASEFLIRHQSLVDTKLIELSHSHTHLDKEQNDRADPMTQMAG